MGNLPINGNLPIEAKGIASASMGNLPINGNLPIEAKAIPGIG